MSSDPEAALLAPDPPEISILMLSWNTRELTLRCLDSLPASATKGLRYEVIVVDNGSRDGSAEALAKRSDIQLIANAENRGYAAGVNQAYARARGNLILLLNSDIEFAPGALSVLHDFLLDHDEVAGVGPLYLNPDGTFQQHHYRLPTFSMILANTSGLLSRVPALAGQLRAYRMLDEDFSRPRPVQQPSASCLLLRKSRLPAGRLLDERFPIYFNDVALAHSLATQGHQLWMTPDSVVIHEHGASTRLLGAARVRQHVGAQVRYVAATQPRYRLFLFRSLVFVEKLLALLLRRPGALGPGELIKALRGDPGPLPQGPTTH
jgi:GT2 family glycosyltransferase